MVLFLFVRSLFLFVREWGMVCFPATPSTLLCLSSALSAFICAPPFSFQSLPEDVLLLSCEGTSLLDILRIGSVSQLPIERVAE